MDNQIEQETRKRLESEYGKIWDTEQLKAEFEVTGFLAPFVVARRKAENKIGSLMFIHSPRFYFSWVEDKPL